MNPPMRFRGGSFGGACSSRVASRRKVKSGFEIALVFGVRFLDVFVWVNSMIGI